MAIKGTPLLSCVRTTPITSPSIPATLGTGQVAAGKLISPIQRLRVMEEDEWEDFIAEWVDSLRIKGVYTEVHRCGGGGDLGRDVIGFKGVVGSQCAWDNYQCKHYGKPINVANVTCPRIEERKPS